MVKDSLFACCEIAASASHIAVDIADVEKESSSIKEISTHVEENATELVTIGSQINDIAGKFKLPG